MSAASSSSSDKQKPANTVPPGMVLGPDGKPCKVCTAFRNWKPGTTNYTEPNSNKGRPATRNTTKASVNSQRQKQSADNAVLSFPSIAGVVAGASTRSRRAKAVHPPNVLTNLRRAVHPTLSNSDALHGRFCILQLPTTLTNPLQRNVRTCLCLSVPYLSFIRVDGVQMI